MTQIHTCYTTSIALKKFLHNSCPEPLDKCYWINEHGDIRSVYKEEVQEWYIPIFCLHDLLSKPFTDAMGEIIDPGCSDSGDDLAYVLYEDSTLGLTAALKP